MAIGYGVEVPKGEPRKRTKRRKMSQEAIVKRRIRALVVERDEYCRIGVHCAGPSEWAHLEDMRRARTRGMDPVLRHTTKGTVMLCRKHHTAYDRGEMTIAFMTSAGADGYVRWNTP